MSASIKRTIIRHSEKGNTVHEETGDEMSVRATVRCGSLRHRVAAAMVGSIACLAMAVSAAPAMASWGFHKGIHEEGKYFSPTGVALDEAGDIDVSTFGADIDKFNLAGELASPALFGGSALRSGVAVNPVSHNVYVVNAEEQTIEAFDPTTGQLAHSFGIPGTGNILGAYTFVEIAADSHGNVYVPDAPGNKIEVFSEEGKAPEGGVASEITGGGTEALKSPEGVAVAPTGDVWVADTGDGRIEEFEPNGAFIKEITSPDAQAVAVDGAGDVFASIGGEGVESKVIEYDPQGTQIDEFGAGVLKESLFGLPSGIAFDDAREILYVADMGGEAVQRFVSWADITDPASGVTETSATLHGTVEVEAGTSIPSCKFEYGTTTAYGNSVPCSPSGDYTETTSVSATVSKLTAGMDYHYRISATNAGGFTQIGEDQSFGPPAIDSESAEAAITTATPRADISLLAKGEATCKVQFVDEPEYDASGYANAVTVPCDAPIGTTAGEYKVEAQQLEGLQPDTVYHYRFLATDQVGTTTGPDREFATFGIASNSFAFQALKDEAGEPVTEAGAHPYAWTDKFALNTSTHAFVNGLADSLAPDANAKDVITELPPGLIGNPDAVPKCEPYDVERSLCSGASQVGFIKVWTASPPVVENYGRLELYGPAPIYNVVPPKGMAAQFAANVGNFAEVRIDSRVRTGGDYGVTAEVLNSSAEEGLVNAEVTLWGVPAAEGHYEERFCPARPGTAYGTTPCSERGPLIPFLSDPTSCTGNGVAHMSVDSWQEPSLFASAEAKMPAITGCGKVPFKPVMKIMPTSSVSDSPTGLEVALKVPQEENPEGIATADLKDATVTLPAGVTVNPSSASGLTGCPLLTGKEAHEGQSGIDLENSEPANCPATSKVGKVTIKTPLLEEELEGGIYVAQQNGNPFKTLLALYIAADAPERGVVVKLAGHVELNSTTGQLTTTFDENPQLPFETLKLDFYEGPRAPLATPRTCGTYEPTSMLEPFSHQGAPGEEGAPDAEPPIAPFTIASSPNGIACGSSPFSPVLEAGTESNQAGSYSPFVMNLTRKDGEQHLSTVNLTMPPGISGILSSVPLCSQAQAEANACSAASQVGHVVVQAGVGSEPITLPEAGKAEDPVYLLSKTEGAPFGLAIVVHPEAGPFNLEEGGKPIIVLSKLTVNPRTAQVSVASKAMPTMLQGIPVDVKAIHVVIDRKGFMFNPTSCEPLSVTGSIGSVEGASANVTSRFQAAGCRGLAFAPTLSASTSAHVSRKDGASLHVKIAYPKGSVGTDANLRYVQVKLPHGLPSRLETLKQACTAKQFAANPGGCPAASVVGHAVVHTPVLPVPLTGPAYFVGHGGAQWPELVMVLQGDGVTVQLNGSTFISKGVTSSTFAANPDVPFSSFELTLPRGAYSALSFNGSLCTTRQNHQVVQRHMTMPTVMIGQNGAKIEEQTPVDVEGCVKRIETRKVSVKGERARIVVKVPYAGKLTAEGKGIESTKTISKKAGQTTLTVKLTPQSAEKLRNSHRNQIQVEVHLAFQAKHHGALHEAVAVTLR